MKFLGLGQESSALLQDKFNFPGSGTKCWQDEVHHVSDMLAGLSFYGIDGTQYSIDEAFHRWQELTIEDRDNKKTIYLIGNGASASMSSHFAADLAKNAYLHTGVFSDLSLITAISNDMGYEWVAVYMNRRFQGR